MFQTVGQFYTKKVYFFCAYFVLILYPKNVLILYFFSVWDGTVFFDLDLLESLLVAIIIFTTDNLEIKLLVFFVFFYLILDISIRICIFM